MARAHHRVYVGDEPLPIDRRGFERGDRTDDAGDIVRTAAPSQLLTPTVNDRFQIDP